MPQQWPPSHTAIVNTSSLLTLLPTEIIQLLFRVFSWRDHLLIVVYFKSINFCCLLFYQFYQDYDYFWLK